MPMKPIETLPEVELQKIHDATISVLETVGVGFLSEKAIEVFKANGFRTEDTTVFFTDEQIKKALSTCPSSFKVHARNPEKSVVIGGDSPVASPIYGPPYVIDFDGNLRRSTLDDYHTLLKLAHMLPSQSMTGFCVCDPSDVPTTKAHRYMLHAALTVTDQPFMGCSSQGEQGVEEMMQMAEIAFGKDRKHMQENTFSMSLINSLTPLRFEGGVAEAIMALASNNQAMLMASCATAGATAPITLAGLLVVQNAEILAGLTLAQLVNPGTPIVYGCASGVMDMHTVVMTLGAPEFARIMRAAVPLAHWYGLPCRAGGGVTESCDVDAQAGLESMSGLLNAMNLGVDYVQHSIGCVSSYMGASFTKFVMDDEIFMHAKAQREPIDFSDSEDGFSLNVIAEVGQGGEFLTTMHTAEHCRDIYRAKSSYNSGLEQWFDKGCPSIKERYRDRGLKLVSEYEAPAIDDAVLAKLNTFLDD